MHRERKVTLHIWWGRVGGGGQQQNTEQNVGNAVGDSKVLISRSQYTSSQTCVGLAFWITHQALGKSVCPLFRWDRRHQGHSTCLTSVRSTDRSGLCHPMKVYLSIAPGNAASNPLGLPENEMLPRWRVAAKQPQASFTSAFHTSGNNNNNNRNNNNE